jgi:aerobic carbon-monoxide dehydrogenase medium subunit
VKPAAFKYHAPETVDDVVGLLAEHGDEAKVLAGGQSLVPMLSMRLTRFANLFDVNRVPMLAGIERDDGTLTVGATTRQSVLERTSDASAVPLLGLVAPLIGHFQIRNRGTVGGSIAHADPAAELPAVALALDASLEVASATGTRWIAAEEFFVGTWETALGDDELLAAIQFPVWSGRCGFAVDEVARRHGDFALAGAVCGVELDDAGSTIRRVAIAMLGMGSTPLRARAAEAALAGLAPGDADLEGAAQLAIQDLDPPEDIHASSHFRLRLGARTVQNALSGALAEATNA